MSIRSLGRSGRVSGIALGLSGLASLVGCGPTTTSHPPAMERSRLTATSASDAVAGQIHVSLLPKEIRVPALTRLVTPTAQVVATPAPVVGAWDSVAVAPKPGERLVLVELPLAGDQPVPGELARFDRIAVASLPWSTELHAIGGDPRRFGRPVGTTLQAPLPQLPTRNFFAAPAATSLTTRPRAGAPTPVSRAALERAVRELSGDVPTGFAPGSERRSTGGRDQARAYLKERYEALGYRVTLSSYEGDGFGSSGANLIAERAGRDSSRTVLVTSHLDSVGNPGADDNAAGTISALAVAEALKDTPLAVNLRLVAFDEEEIGLVGSAAYVRQLRDAGRLEDVAAVINLEMTGYDSDDDGAFHAMDCGEGSSAELTGRVKDVIAARADLRLRWVDACTNRSDHASFWDVGKPAIVVSQNFFDGDANPCYHKACDQVERMNFDYMTRMTALLTEVVYGLTTAAPAGR